MILILVMFSLYLGADTTILKEALELSYHERYEEAESLFRRAVDEFPKSPLPPLFYAGLLDMYMLDFSTDDRQEDFMRLLNTTIKRAERIIGEEGEEEWRRAWACFAKGSALAYKAMFYGRKRNFVKALYYAFPARKWLLRAIKIDSTLYDAYLPLGTYDYALSELPKILRWLVNSEDRREKALKEMKLAMERGQFVSVIAQDAYAWTLAYHRRFREAKELARDLMRHYPNSRTFRWTLTFVLRRSGAWREAAKEYEKLYYLVVRDHRDSPYCMAIVLVWLSKAHYFSRERERALREARAGLILTQMVKDKKDREYLEKSFSWLLGRRGY
jgi:tetratricopeptide (TPR) repeat protein